MSSGRRKFVVRHPVVVDIGCSCRRPKLPSLFSSSPKPKPPKTPSPLSPSTPPSYWETSFTATTVTTNTAANSSSPSRYGDCTSSPSPPLYPPENPRRTTARGQQKTSKNTKKNKCGASAAARKGVAEGSMAVVKESSDPYLDFRDSMLQMIAEMEIYAWDDLRDLLHFFLALNAPRHHYLILRAFAEILNGVFSSPSPSPSPSASAGDAPRT